jgi:antitoxin MazE
MKNKVQKWGNSMAVRIPKAFVKEAQLSYGACVDLTMEEGKLIIEPRVEPEYRLEDLLKDVTRHNRHGERQTGSPVGREAW